MLSLGAFAFAAPGMLALLLVLPVIYWLLRMIPPLPKLVRFPAIRLLIGLEPTEQTPMKMPWWLLLLRLLLATALILAVARPLLNPQADLPGRGPADAGDRRRLVVGAGLDHAHRPCRAPDPARRARAAARSC